MSTVQPNYLFLNSPAAADVTLVNRILTLGQNANAISMNVQKVESIRKVEGVAAVATTATVTITTPAGIAGVDYSFQIIQQSGSEYRPVFVSYESVTGNNADAVAAALTSVVNAQIRAGNLGLASASSTGAVITLTATTSNPIFLVEVLEAGAGMVVAPTLGNEAFGQGADLLAEGVIGISEQPVAGTSYDALFIPYGIPVEEGNTIKRDQAAYLVVYYNEATGAGLTAFLGALNAAIAAVPSLSSELVTLSDAIA